LFELQCVLNTFWRIQTTLRIHDQLRRQANDLPCPRERHPKTGKRIVMQIEQLNIAERLYRTTDA
jgi:hypothetical protein